MTAQTNAVHCVFYSHPWAVDALKGLKVGPLDDTVLIELAHRSQLASLIDRQHRLRHGIAGLLADPGRIDELAEVEARFPVPVVFAPNPHVGDNALVSAVSLLPSLESRYRRFLVFVHLSEYERFKFAYPYCDKFMFLWDIADPPIFPLASLAATLEEMDCLNRSSWGGFYWFSHPKRRVGDASKRLRQLREALRTAPMLAPSEAS